MSNVRFVYITMDGGHNSALREAAQILKKNHGITMHLSLHSMSSLRTDEDWARLEKDALQADFIFGGMIFGEEHVRPMERILDASSAPKCIITSNTFLSTMT